jgi:hypothetical protein
MASHATVWTKSPHSFVKRTVAEALPGVMSDWACRFLIHWLALPAVQRLAAAVRLASARQKDTVAAGIPPQEIRAAAGGNLIRKILEALNTVARLSK